MLSEASHDLQRKNDAAKLEASLTYHLSLYPEACAFFQKNHPALMGALKKSL